MTEMEYCGSCGKPLLERLTAAEDLPESLTGWSNQMAARFARPVYLCGSALKLQHPRDYDIRIVLTDEEFEHRYGDPCFYESSAWLPKRFPQMLSYYEDMAKLTRQGVLACHLNLDFQVHPMKFAQKERYRDQPRKRLDLLADVAEAPWE